jgi:hypothetical protein
LKAGKRTTGKHSHQHTLRTLISREEMLVYDSTNSLGVDFTLEVGQIIRVVFFLAETIHELRLVTQSIRNTLVHRECWSLD